MSACIHRPDGNLNLWTRRGIVAGLLLSSPALLAASDGQWTASWAQGTSEYISQVDNKNGLNISCSDTDPVWMLATINGKEYGPSQPQAFDLIVDGTRYTTPYKTGSRLGANSFYRMWDQLRHAKNITVAAQDGQTLQLPTKGIQNALPATNSNEFGCIMNPGPDDLPTASSQQQQPASNPVQTAPISGNELGLRVYRDEYHRPILEVISKTDMLVITGLKINRGNCSTLKEIYPKRLAFGASHQFSVWPYSCNVLEAVILTDRGPASFSFQ